MPQRESSIIIGGVSGDEMHKLRKQDTRRPVIL